VIDGFFRRYYGGNFLERDFRTSSPVFDVTFKVFAEGTTAIWDHAKG